jgi:hypothetical protein
MGSDGEKLGFVSAFVNDAMIAASTPIIPMTEHTEAYC